MTARLSVYVLTFNSDKRLNQVLEAARKVADDLLVVDSGSTDSTINIAKRHDARVLFRKFDNFRDQRVFAEDACENDWILTIDSDEVISESLAKKIVALKNTAFASDAGVVDGFSIKRNWFFLGRSVRTYYPVNTPEYVVRLFNKTKTSTKGSRIIHESLDLSGCRIGQIEEPIDHYSCDSVDDLYAKIGLYTRLSADDMHSHGIKSSWIKIYIYPWLIWAKWYLINGAWKDGELGLILCSYARTTTYLKYLKLKYYANKIEPQTTSQ